jgi:hypothetical protein
MLVTFIPTASGVNLTNTLSKEEKNTMTKFYITIEGEFNNFGHAVNHVLEWSQTSKFYSANIEENTDD